MDYNDRHDWLNAFLESTSVRDRMVKWAVVFLLFLVGLGFFAYNLNGALAYEQACKNPVFVQAAISVDEVNVTTSWDQPAPRWNLYLSYEYNGVKYQGIYYEGRQNPYYKDREGEVITVALNPEDPAQLRMWMVNNFAFGVSIVPICAGLALLFHEFLGRLDSFKRWRRGLAEKYPRMLYLDHFKDVFAIFILLLLPAFLMLHLLFPYTIPL